MPVLPSRLAEWGNHIERWWLSQTVAARLFMVAAGVVGFAALSTAVVLTNQSEMGAEEPPAVVFSPTVETSTPAASATPRPPSNVAYEFMEPDRLPVSETLPTITDIETLIDRYGAPPGTEFATFRIPALGVSAPVGARYVGADGIMANPAGPADVVWYDFTEFPALGGTPGNGFNAVFSGHVDYNALVPYAGVNYRGRGVFYSIPLLSPGDIIEIDYGGQTLTYAVEWRQEINASGGGFSGMLRSDTGRDAITLITCSGGFDSASQEYDSRTVVRAVRI